MSETFCGKGEVQMKKKIHVWLPVFLCCLLACGIAVGVYYAQGVSLMKRAMAADLAYLSAHDISAEKLSQALGEKSLSSDQVLEVADQVRQGTDIEMDNYYTGYLAERFQQNCQSFQETPLKWDFSLESGSTNGRLFYWKAISSTEVEVHYMATHWLTSMNYYTQDSKPRYTVDVIFSRDISTAQLEKVDGQWKVVSEKITSMEFAPDSYDSVQGSFDSCQEALKFVTNLNEREINPFFF